MPETVVLDDDVVKLLDGLRIRTDESLAQIIGRISVYAYDWEPLNPEEIKALRDMLDNGEAIGPFKTAEDLDKYIQDMLEAEDDQEKEKEE
jgi:type VI protein secretion system component Hcp